MTKRYGLPYMGSKNLIAKPLIDEMLKYKPNAKVFIDLFGGGGAMSLCVLEEYPQFEKVVYNEYNKKIYDMFNYCLYDLPNEKDLSSLIVNRDDFIKILNKSDNEKTGKDMTILNINSFGNKTTTYLWSKEIEDVKYDLSRYVLVPTKQLKDLIKEKYNIDLTDTSNVNDMHKRRMILYKDVSKSNTNSISCDKCRLESLERLQSL